jgi:hypothetical protein
MCHNSSRHDGPDAINHLRKASADRMCPKATPSLARRPHNGLRGCAGSLDGAALPLDQWGTRVAHPPKTNQLSGVGTEAAE